MVFVRWLFFVTASDGMSAAFAASINIYSHRMRPDSAVFGCLYGQTGVETKVVHAAKGLAQRLQAEGEASPADVILTVDIARLAEYANLDLLAPVSSGILAYTPRLRAKDGRCFSERARIIVTSKTGSDGSIADLEDLAKPEWKGRVLHGR